MPSALSIKLGDFLYKNAFPVYNLIYPIFKRKQDKHEIALLNKYIKNGDVVLDIGANIGFYTKILSDLVGSTGKVYAFEPDKTNFSYLQKNASVLKNVSLINKAVSVPNIRPTAPRGVRNDLKTTPRPAMTEPNPRPDLLAPANTPSNAIAAPEVNPRTV